MFGKDVLMQAHRELIIIVIVIIIIIIIIFFFNKVVFISKSPVFSFK